MTLGSWLVACENKLGDAVHYKENKIWHTLSWNDYLNKIILIADFLEKKGLKKKHHVGIMSSTRWEWAAADMAILGSRCVTVPFYPNLSNEDLIYTINHSEIQFLIIENSAHQKQIDQITSKLIKPPEVILIDEINIKLTPDTEMKDHFFKKCLSIKPLDIATIVYTSGTTGQPKGAVLLHEAIVSEIVESFTLFGVKPNYKSLTFLPFAHVLGRIEHWGSCYIGHSLAYAESIEKIKSNLLEVQPDFMIAVPRIFEKIYSGIMAQVETQPLKLQLFNRALEIAKEVQLYRKTKQAIPWAVLAQYEALNRIVFSSILKAFGGKLLFAISGGAPLSQQLGDFFSSCGLQILEGYGLTETCGAITVNTFANYQSGSVGLPIGDVEIKFGDDQEILIKSKKCLKEYYKNTEATRESLKNGFFATGDIGHLNEKGFLKITDRKKDLIKTAGGKYVAPQKLEGLMKQEPLISQILIHGDQKKFIIGLISIDEAQIKAWADSQKIIYSDYQELYQNPVLRQRIQKQVQNVNAELASYESIKKFEIVSDSWTVENGCLTQSMKIKRKIVEKKYAELIDQLYE